MQPDLQCMFTPQPSHQITFSCAAVVQLRQKDLELQLAEVRRKESEEGAQDFQVQQKAWLSLLLPLLL